MLKSPVKEYIIFKKDCWSHLGDKEKMAICSMGQDGYSFNRDTISAVYRTR